MNEIDRSTEPTTRVDVLQLIRVAPDDFAPLRDSDCALYPNACKGTPCALCGECGQERGAA